MTEEEARMEGEGYQRPSPPRERLNEWNGMTVGDMVTCKPLGKRSFQGKIRSITRRSSSSTVEIEVFREGVGAAIRTFTPDAVSKPAPKRGRK